MPWARDHKSRTRKRILATAAVAFRSRGVEGVRVDDVMDGAGLTRGGFYAHFRSKEEMLEAAFELASLQTVERLTAALQGRPNQHPLSAVIDAYLSPEHARHPDQGCPVAALGPEMARSPARMRRALARSIRHRLEWMRRLVPRGREVPEEELVGVMAGLVGGVVLARSMGGAEGSAILEATRQFLRRSLGKSLTVAPAPRRRSRPARRG